MSGQVETPAAQEERAHALLGASSAKIWLTCTPSARFGERYEDKGSEAASEGTAAHTLAELMLRVALGGDPAQGITELQAGANLEQFKSCEPRYCGEMEEAITGYVGYVLERFEAARAQTPDAQLLLEQRLDYGIWVPEGFGTADVVIIADKTLEVIDLKYGKGVPVTAVENPQAMIYGLGAWNEHGMLYDFEEVRMTIYQPRLDSVTTYVLATEALLRWAEDYVTPRAVEAWAGEGEYVAGEHCRFCKGNARCRALAEHNTELARYDFAHPNELSLAEIGEVMKRAEMLTTWLKRIEDYALDQVANAGATIPGWKLVEGRSNRKYADQDKVAEALKAAGYAEALIYERNLLGITAMEEALGKKTFTTLVGDLCIKPPGKAALALETDPRPAMGSTAAAAADFAATE